MIWTWFKFSPVVSSQMSLCNVFLCEFEDISPHNISKTLWSLGLIPVKTVCSVSAVMPCVNQQTFPVTICQHPFCPLLRKAFTNSKWKSSWWLPVPHACYHCLDSSNGSVYDCTPDFWTHCIWESALRITPVPALVSAQCTVYIVEKNLNSTHIWLFILDHHSQINI